MGYCVMFVLEFVLFEVGIIGRVKFRVRNVCMGGWDCKGFFLFYFFVLY